jgi:hypothetical protein
MYHLKLQPSEIEGLNYYEYWYYVKDMSDVISRENKSNDEQQEQMNTQSAPSMKMPKFNTPSFKIPKL